LPGKLKIPIFLFGNVRCGTSLMRNLFNLHPEIVKWYEPRTVWVYAEGVGVAGARCAGRHLVDDVAADEGAGRRGIGPVQCGCD